MKYISVYDYLEGLDISTLPSDVIGNINTLIPTINQLFDIIGYSRDITSGFRSPERHLKVYETINNKRKNQGLSPLKVPMGSKHLIGAAVDLEDRNGRLDIWCMSNQNTLKTLGLYLEHPNHTIGWCHLQIIPPKSKKIVFIP
jgi:hypothetical protein